MNDATQQQAIEILHMIYQKTQQNHIVSFSKETMGNGVVISIDNMHNHATGRVLWGNDENQNLEIIIHGLYDKLVHENSGWSSTNEL